MDAKERLLEQVLILRCQIGDSEALKELFNRYKNPLRYFINRLLDDSEVADDVFQDTWLTVLRKIRTLKQLDAFTVWLYRIARNKVYQQFRKKRVWTELDESLLTEEDTNDDGFSSEDAAKIHKCLEKLKLQHKEVLMLRFLEQMTYQQIADVVGCNLGTVRSRIFHAKIALKAEMEK